MAKSKTLKNKKRKFTKSKKIKCKENSLIIDKSLYPFWYNKIPFPQISTNNKLIDEKIWAEHLKLASKLYENKASLPKKSVLFHGSAYIDPIKDVRSTNKPLFFGLDAFIAIWYISEFASKNISALEKAIDNLKRIETYIPKDKNMKKYADESKKEAIKKQELFIKSLELFNIEFFSIDNYPELNNYKKMLNNLKSNNRRYYFLNIYQTTQDIPYKYLSKSVVDENPLDFDECKKTACMHPQFGYHLHELKPPVELSIEFTIPANQIGNKLKLIGVYVIDVFKLNENKNKNYNEFKAIESIVLKSDFTK